MKKLFTLATTTLAALAMTFALTGCGQSELDIAKSKIQDLNLANDSLSKDKSNLTGMLATTNKSNSVLVEQNKNFAKLADEQADTIATQEKEIDRLTGRKNAEMKAKWKARNQAQAMKHQRDGAIKTAQAIAGDKAKTSKLAAKPALKKAS